MLRAADRHTVPSGWDRGVDWITVRLAGLGHWRTADVTRVDLSASCACEVDGYTSATGPAAACTTPIDCNGTVCVCDGDRAVTVCKAVRTFSHDPDRASVGV